MRKIKIVETELEDYPINNGKVTVIKKIPKFGAPPLLFRADTRSVKVIRNSGFNARNLDFKLDDAKKYVRDSFSQSCNSALVWSIAGTQSMAGKWISTADERSCMGYESKVRPHNIPEINSKDDFAKLPNGAIYVFKIDNFREVKPTNEVLGFNPLGEIKFPIRLYLNAETLNDATIIGIRPKFDSREIIFLTSIPASAIIGIVDFSNEDYYISFE